MRANRAAARDGRPHRQTVPSRCRTSLIAPIRPLRCHSHPESANALFSTLGVRVQTDWQHQAGRRCRNPGQRATPGCHRRHGLLTPAARPADARGKTAADTAARPAETRGSAWPANTAARPAETRGAARLALAAGPGQPGRRTVAQQAGWPGALGGQRAIRPVQRLTLACGLDCADRDRLRPAVALLDIELNSLAFFKTAVAIRLNGGEVDEDVPATVDRDEAVALVRVEPFDGALSHHSTP